MQNNGSLGSFKEVPVLPCCDYELKLSKTTVKKLSFPFGQID
jgi:hypothetical protein